MKLALDLFCGYKTATKALEESPDWWVVGVDLNPKVKPDIIADARALPFRKGLSPDFLWASPPCTHFSNANPHWPRKGVMEAFQLMGAAFEAVAELNPKYWMIENPRGRSNGLFPKPKQTIRYSDFDTEYPTQKPTNLWSNFDLPLAPNIRRPYSGRRQTTGVNNWALHQPRDPTKRAAIPRGVSNAVQTSLEVLLE